MEALGFALTQLLRHGHRGPDHRYNGGIPGMADLEWGVDVSLTLTQVVVQPAFRMMRAVEDDI